MRLVTTDEQDLADHVGPVGSGGRREGVRDVTDVDGLDPTVGGQQLPEVELVDVEAAAGIDGHHATESEHDPVESAVAHHLLGGGLELAVEVGGRHRRRGGEHAVVRCGLRAP